METGLKKSPASTPGQKCINRAQPPMPFRRVISIFSRLIMPLVLPVFAWCGTFTVTPVRIQISTSRPNAVMQIVNRDDQPVTVQAHVVAWNTDGQNDVYADSNEIMLNPPIAVIPAHQSQLIRLGLRHPTEGTQEQSYRLILEEVPPPARPDFRGIQTLLRLSIPIFAVPKTKISPQITWRAVKTDDSQLRLIAVNQGTAHVQIKSLEVRSGESSDDFLKGTPPAYLLPSQQRQWMISAQSARTATQVRITAVTDAGTSHEVIEITAR